MKVQRKVAPLFAHAETEYQARDDGHDPGNRAEKSRGRNTHRLLIDEDCAWADVERRKRPLDQPKASAQNRGGKNEEEKEQLEFDLEDVPVDRRIAERSEPQRRHVDRKTSGADKQKKDKGGDNPHPPTTSPSRPLRSDVDNLIIPIEMKGGAQARLGYLNSLKRPMMRLVRQKRTGCARWSCK